MHCLLSFAAEPTLLDAQNPVIRLLLHVWLQYFNIPVSIDASDPSNPVQILKVGSNLLLVGECLKLFSLSRILVEPHTRLRPWPV